MRSLRRCVSLLAFVLAALPFAQGQTPLRLQNVTPCRLVDTRLMFNGMGFNGTQTFNLPALALAGGAYGTCTPFSLSTAQAYSLNVTLVPTSGPVFYLTIWPAGEPQPLVSLMNSYDARTKANAAIVPAGTNGEVSVFVTNTTNVLIDINAYFDSASDSSSLAFFPLPPCRIVDTRHGNGGTLQANHERDYTIPGNCGIPGTAAAYSFNVTVLPAGGLPFLTVWPKGEPFPTVSTLNDNTGTVVANAVIVPAGPDNATAFYPASNNTDLLVDTNGYFAPAASGSNPLSLYNLVPCRVLDTRNGFGLFDNTIPVAVVGSSCGIPASNPEAYVFNATVVPQVGEVSFLTLWPQGLPMPTVSTLNADDAAITSNMAIVPAGADTNAINAFIPGPPGGNPGQLILDIASYFAPISAINIPESNLPDGTQNQAYSYQLVANGGVPPYTWQLIQGVLPTGLTLSPGGLIQGTTTVADRYLFEVQATDSDSPAGNMTATLSLNVFSMSGTLGIQNTSLPNGTVNTPYNALLTANGGITPYTWSIVSGTLPTGLSLNANTGLISGVPGAAGYSNLTFMVSDSANHHAMAALPIAVNTGAANATINGMYAGSFSGYDQGNWLVVQFSITTDGAGNIITGEYDANGSVNGVEHGTITGGTYTVGSNGLGQINWSDNHGGHVSLLISVGTSEDIRIIYYNTNGQQGSWGAGVIRQQNAADFHVASLAGAWTFGFEGFQTDNATAGAGLYHQDASGNLSGQEDINIGGLESTVQFTGSMTAPDSNGRVTVQLHFNSMVLNYAGYVVSAGQALITETDSGHQITATSLRQSGTLGNGILHGKAVGRESRAKNNGMLVSDAFVLLVSFDGAGHDSLTIDENFGGTLLLQQMASGSYSVDPSTGRTFVGNGAGGGDLCYPVQRNEAFCFDPSSGHPGTLFFQEQAAGPFNTASLAGQYMGGSLPQYVPATDSTIDVLFLDGSGNGSITYSQTGPDPPLLNQTGTGTYSVDSTGHLILMSGGNPLGYGYLVGPGRFFAISTNGDPRVLIHAKSAAP